MSFAIVDYLRMAFIEAVFRFRIVGLLYIYAHICLPAMFLTLSRLIMNGHPFIVRLVFTWPAFCVSLLFFPFIFNVNSVSMQFAAADVKRFITPLTMLLKHLVLTYVYKHICLTVNGVRDPGRVYV